MAEKDNQFEKLFAQLTKEKNWPLLYMFKFIVPADNKHIALIQSKFSDYAVITQKESSGGKYISFTVKELMLTPESIIAKYKEMATIDGLMAF